MSRSDQVYAFIRDLDDSGALEPPFVTGRNGSSPGIDRISGLYPGLITVGASPSAKKRTVIRRR
ncbi:MAG TPA: hypothetical protein VKP66_01205 [Steroidobacteraceae bacterium]|nr:hypothetical protein [Steroidobacteraceae bacterium]